MKRKLSPYQSEILKRRYIVEPNINPKGMQSTFDILPVEVIRLIAVLYRSVLPAKHPDSTLSEWFQYYPINKRLTHKQIYSLICKKKSID